MTLAPEGRRLLRIEARNAAVPIERKPEWIKTRANMGPEYTKLRSLVVREGLTLSAKKQPAQISLNAGKIGKRHFLLAENVARVVVTFAILIQVNQNHSIAMNQGVLLNLYRAWNFVTQRSLV